MKNFKHLLSLALVAIILSSCGASRQGFGASSIQKRKYTKGFYLNRNSGLSAKKDAVSTKDEVVTEEVIQTENIAKVENTDAAPVKSTVVNNSVASNEVATEKAVEENTKIVSKSVKSSSTAVVSTKNNHKKAPKATKEKNVATLKQKKQSKNASGGSDGMFILAVIFAILIPPLGVLIYTSIDWMKVLICFLLCFLFILPGMIYALLVVFDVI